METPYYLKTAEAEYEKARSEKFEELDLLYQRLHNFRKEFSKELKKEDNLTADFVDERNAEIYRFKTEMDAILELHNDSNDRSDYLKVQAEQENLVERLKDKPELLELQLGYQSSVEEAIDAKLGVIFEEQRLLNLIIKRVAVENDLKLYTLDEVLQNYNPCKPGEMFA